jgi:hypothetical protein
MVLYKDDILYADQTSKMKMILTTEPLKWKFGLNIPLQCVHIANPRLLPVVWSSLFKNDNHSWQYNFLNGNRGIIKLVVRYIL